MVRCWFFFVLVISSVSNVLAWRPSTEDRRNPAELRKDLTLDRRDVDRREVGRRDVIIDRRGVKQGRRDATQDRIDGLDYIDITQSRREVAKNRREPRELQRAHYHSKRHMLPDPEPKKKSTTLKPTGNNMRDVRKKPSGHLTPIEDDDMEIDEVVSVAIGPPPLRGKFEKPRKKPISKPSLSPTPSAVGLVKDLLMQITKEFLSRDVDENFVFGQYLGNAMKNLTSELRLSMQHEVLELIVKYQKANTGEGKVETETKSPQMMHILKDVKIEKKFISSNDTDEQWPDFTNLAKIVG